MHTYLISINKNFFLTFNNKKKSQRTEYIHSTIDIAGTQRNIITGVHNCFIQTNLKLEIEGAWQKFSNPFSFHIKSNFIVIPLRNAKRFSDLLIMVIVL